MKTAATFIRINRNWISLWLALLLLPQCTALSSILDDDGGAKNRCAISSGQQRDLRIHALQLAPSPEQITSVAAWSLTAGELSKSIVQPCITDEKTNLIVLPDGLTNLFALAGENLATARAANTITEARSAVLDAYGAQILAYQNQFGAMSDERALALALTNTLQHAANRFAGQLAQDSDAYVALPIRLASSARATSDPTARANFGDADVDPLTTYVAETTDIVARTLIYGPDGKVAFDYFRGYAPRQPQLNLIEAQMNSPVQFAALPFPVTSETGQKFLNLAFLDGREVQSLELQNRIAELDVHALVIHNQVSRWAGFSDDVWIPAQQLFYSWLSVQRFAPLVAAIHAVPNSYLFPFFRDGQSFVAAKVSPNLNLNPDLLGLHPTLGVTTVADWILSDALDPFSATLTEVRDNAVVVAAERDQALANGGMVTDLVSQIIVADIATPGGIAYPFSPAQTPVSSAHQKQFDVALINNKPLLAWSQRSSEQTTIHWGEIGGQGIVDRGAIADIATNGRSVALAATTDGATAVWSQGAVGLERIRFADFDPQTKTWSQSAVVSTAPTTQWQPVIAIDRSTGRSTAAWLDLAESTAIRVATRQGNNFVSPSAITAVTAANDQKYPSLLGSPAIAAADGKIWIVWTQATANTPAAVFFSYSQNGQSFSHPTPVTTTFSNNRIALDVDIAATADDVNIVWSESNINEQRSQIQIARLSANDGKIVAIESLGQQSDKIWQLSPTISVDADRFLVAWKTIDRAEIRINIAVRSTGTGNELPQVVATSDPDTYGHLWQPLAVATQAGIVTFWTDGAGGYSQIRLLEGQQN